MTAWTVQNWSRIITLKSHSITLIMISKESYHHHSRKLMKLDENGYLVSICFKILDNQTCHKRRGYCTVQDLQGSPKRQTPGVLYCTRSARLPQANWWVPALIRGVTVPSRSSRRIFKFVQHSNMVMFNLGREVCKRY
jgi:hypothetical protein